jgi:hypothetical protein
VVAQRERAAALQGKDAASQFLTGDTDGQALVDGLLAALAALAEADPRTASISVTWTVQRDAAEAARQVANAYLSGEESGKQLNTGFRHAVKLLVQRPSRGEQVEQAWAEYDPAEADPAALEAQLAALGW